MKFLKKIGCGLLAFVCTFVSEVGAQSRVVPDEPAVPHFIQLQRSGNGTFSGEAVSSQTVLSEQIRYDFAHGEQIRLEATADPGSKLTRITEIGPDGREVDLNLSGLPADKSFSFDYYLNYSVVLKAYFTTKSYAVNWQLTNLRTDYQPTTAEHGTTFEFTLIPDVGYRLPENIEIGHWENGKEYTYDSQTGRVVLHVGLEYAITICAEAEEILEPDINLKWNSFAGRYFETNVVADAQCGIQIKNSDAVFLFRYVVQDYDSWKDVLNMEYADNLDMNGAKQFDFSEDGTVDILSSATALLPDAYNTYFRFSSGKAGLLQFDIEVYDESGTTLYATLKDIQAYFVDPVQITVTPGIQGYVGEDIAFDLVVTGLDDALTVGRRGTLFMEMDASDTLGNGTLQTDDIHLSYDGTRIDWQEKNGVFYGSVDLGILENNHSYPFVLNSSVPLSAVNKIKFGLSDDRYELPGLSGNEAFPEVVEKEIAFTVSLPELVGAQTDPVAGTYTVVSGGEFAFRIVLDEDYDQSVPVVRVSGQTILPDADGYYRIVVDRAISIEITGIELNPTGVNTVSGKAEAHVGIHSGKVRVDVAWPSVVRVFDLSGKSHGVLQVDSGATYLNLPSGGTYMILIGERTFKVCF